MGFASGVFPETVRERRTTLSYQRSELTSNGT